MKFIFIKNRNELIAALLLGLSAVFGFIILIKTGGLLVTSVRTGMLVKKAIAQSNPDPNEAEKHFAKSRELAEELKKKNLFAPPKPKENPGKGISGILGNEVLISGKWYKIGDKVAEAEIVAIEPAQVKIRWNGRDKYFAPMGAAPTK